MGLVSLNQPNLSDQVPTSSPFKVPKLKMRVNAFKAPKLLKPKTQPAVSMFGNRAIKSPEDYETGEAVQGLGRSVSPYYAQQYAQQGRQLKYDTATNTYR